MVKYKSEIIAIFCIISCFLCYLQRPDSLFIELQYNDKVANGELAQIFFDRGSGFSEGDSILVKVQSSSAKFKISLGNNEIKNLRIDPLSKNENFSIKEISIGKKDGDYLKILGKDLEKYFSVHNIKEKLSYTEDNALRIEPLNDDIQFVAYQNFLEIYKGKSAYLNKYKNFLGILIGVLGLVFLFNIYNVIKKYQCIHVICIEKFFKYRYIIAAIILVILVVFQIHGSSIGLYDDILGYSNQILLWGSNRPIRSDEYIVNTPLAFSQYYNYAGSFSYFSQIVRGCATDMFMVYGQPVFDIAILFRPFQWGYLFLPQGMGLSFFWSGRLIALFLISVEIGLMLSSSRRIAFTYAMLVTFSPVIQWWFAVNGLVEMLIFGQLFVFSIDRYMIRTRMVDKVLFAFFMMISAGAYILTFYPAWQIPLAYVFFILMMWRIKINWVGFKTERKDFFLILVMSLFLGGVFYHIFDQSLNTIKSLMGTVYPGHRFSFGGEVLIKQIFSYGGNLFLPYKDLSFSNNCEASSFFTLFPMGSVLAIIALKQNFKNGKSDFLLKYLLFLEYFMLFWCFIGFPKIFAQFSLLFAAPGNRVFMVMGIIEIILIVRSLGSLNVSIKKNYLIFLSGLISFFVTFSSYYAYSDIFSIGKIFILFFTIFCCCSLLFSLHKTPICIFFCVVMCLIGGTVNPVASGVSSVFGNNIAREIRHIVQEDHSLWMVEGDAVKNYLIMFGAPTINCTNVYPNLERWMEIDRNGEQKDIYNRYAHIGMIISDTASSFVLKGADYFEVVVNTYDLRRLNVKYIFTRNDLGKYSDDFASFEKIFEENGYKIYKVTFKEGNF